MLYFEDVFDCLSIVSGVNFVIMYLNRFLAFTSAPISLATQDYPWPILSKSWRHPKKTEGLM